MNPSHLIRRLGISLFMVWFLGYSNMDFLNEFSFDDALKMGLFCGVLGRQKLGRAFRPIKLILLI